MKTSSFKLLTTTDLQGNVITITDLPPPETVRWTLRKKAIVVRAVQDGLIPLAVVLERYRMQQNEFELWTKEMANAVDKREVVKIQPAQGIDRVRAITKGRQ